MAGMDLVRAVDACERDGGRPDYCLAWATSAESEGGAGITGFSDAELNLAFRLGQDRLQRGERWEIEYEYCVAEHGEELCRDAIIPENDYPYP